MGKPILVLDFDGVIHSYSSGWKGAHVIPDPIVPGAIEFIRAALEHFDVQIYSSRSATPDGVKAMQDWLRKHAENDWELVHDKIGWPTWKPAAFVTIDDRAITFEGAWPNVDVLRKFKPWNLR